MRFTSALMAVAMVSAIDLTKSSKRQASDSSSSSSSSSASDEDTFVQLVSGGVYKVQDIGTGSLDKKYERVVPEHFSAGSDDLFMKSMIMNYSDEGKDCDDAGECKPNGQFTMTEAATRAASAEVLGSHKGLKGAAGSEYLKNYFERTWAHFDVNKDGRIGVETMPQFMRFLSSDQTLNLQ